MRLRRLRRRLEDRWQRQRSASDRDGRDGWMAFDESTANLQQQDPG